MKYLKVSSPQELKKFIEALKKNNQEHPASLQEVLQEIMNLDVTNPENATLRYSSIHCVPIVLNSSTEFALDVAVLSYNDTHEELESNSYNISVCNAFLFKTFQSPCYFWYKEVKKIHLKSS